MYHTTIFGAVHCVRVTLSPAEMDPAAKQQKMEDLDTLYKPLGEKTFVGVYKGIKEMPTLGTPRHAIKVRHDNMEGMLNDISQKVPPGTWKGFTVPGDKSIVHGREVVYKETWLFSSPEVGPLSLGKPTLGTEYICQAQYSPQEMFPTPDHAKFNKGVGGLSFEILQEKPPQDVPGPGMPLK